MKTICELLNSIAEDFCRSCCEYAAASNTPGVSLPECDCCPLIELINGEPRKDAIRTDHSIVMQIEDIVAEACDYYCFRSHTGKCLKNCPLKRLI